jgi:hypothetical protein
VLEYWAHRRHLLSSAYIQWAAAGIEHCPDSHCNAHWLSIMSWPPLSSALEIFTETFPLSVLCCAVLVKLQVLKDRQRPKAQVGLAHGTW